MRYQYSDGAFSGVRESQVRGIGRTAFCRIIHIVRIHDHFGQVAILPKVLNTFQYLFGCDLGCKANNVHERFLYDTEIAQLFYFLLGQRADRYFVLTFLGYKPETLQGFNSSIMIRANHYISFRECFEEQYTHLSFW